VFRVAGEGRRQQDVGPAARAAGAMAGEPGLIEEVALAALGAWLADPGGDVEKALRKAMRARHGELGQEARRHIADRVLGAAVLRGRLAHLLAREVSPAAASDPAMLLALFCRRERPGAGACGPDAAEKLAAAAAAPLYHSHERPSAAERLAAAWSLPPWLAQRWVTELGALTAFALGRAMSLPGRVTLRANVLRTTRLELLKAIAAAGVRAMPTAESPWGLWLPDGRPPGGGVWQLPGWGGGLFEVQDEGSQLVALATEARPGERAVDYCAGRGGKTWALAALVAPGGRVRAWDVDGELRLQLRGARAARAGAEGLVDVPEERPVPSPDGAGWADVVMVDAPCSSSGALRRHPSQRWAISEAEVARLAAVQLQVLQEAAAVVRPGGRLVYATCSLLREENADVANSFETGSGSAFRPWPFPGREDGEASGAAPGHHRTLLPHVEGTDGFFIARWTRAGDAC